LDKTSIEVESAKVSSPINGFCAVCQRQQGTANEIVVTAGKMDSPDILFIGEAPSEEDGNNFKPFEDPAGKFLAGAITKGLKLKVKEVGLCNIYKCESITKGSKSDDDEKTTCRDFLHQQIEKINPKVIICLGGTAQMAISGVDRGITKIRGQWQTWKDIPVMPTIHPNYILHNPSAKRDFWEDLKKVMERLGMS